MRTDIRRIAFAYLRLSNEEAAEGESSSIKNQRMIIQDFCDRNEILLARVFVDDGWSGGNFDRPAFQEMIALLEQGKANIVITKDLSAEICERQVIMLSSISLNGAFGI